MNEDYKRVSDLYWKCQQFIQFVNDHYEIVTNYMNVPNACFTFKCHALQHVLENLYADRTEIHKVQQSDIHKQ